jgi:dihydroorotase
MGRGGNLLVRGGRVVTGDGPREGDVLVVDGRVVSAGGPPSDCEVLDATGKLVFPGLIDPQVHFREPGLTHKEDLGSGSLAAVAGGVTSFMEMPNTRPSTTDPGLLEEKLALAGEKSWADHAFFLGATAENAEMLGEWEQRPGCAGVKVFMGSSTGDLLVPDDATLERVLRSGDRRVAVHSEDEARLVQRRGNLGSNATVADHPLWRDVETALRSTRRLLDLVEKTGRKVHLLHVSTAEELELLRERDLGELVTAEVTVHHLFLAAPACYEEHGTGVQMNPPIREERHREALRQALAEGLLTCIGSDHAPHSPEEKARPYPRSPSGIPGVQTTLPLLLQGVQEGWLALADIPAITGSGPARVYGIRHKGSLEPGGDGDLVVVDPAPRPLDPSLLRSRAGYSPYEGQQLGGWPVATVLRGEVVYRGAGPEGTPAGRALEFI